MARTRKSWRFRLDDTTTLEASAPADATRTQIRRRGRWALVVGMLLAILAVGAVLASADTISSDGDVAAAGDQNGATAINLGTVAPGATAHPTIAFSLDCDGSKHADQGQTVNLSFASGASSAPTGGTVSATGGSIGPVPASWPDDTTGSSNCGSTSPLSSTSLGSNSTATLVAPTTPGTYSYVVAYSTSLSPTGNSDPSSLTGSVPKVTYSLTVSAPVNAAPQVSISGVTNGATYDKGSVPSATCNVTDAEDGNSSFAATLSAITGPNSADGLGSQTASCSYTDAGGLTASATATYSIVDTTAPVITYDLSGTLGDNGWYVGNVTLTWHVSDPDSPNSLQKTGCVDQSIAADQSSTDYACSATSAGGSTGPVTVSIKRDATAPSVSCGSADGAWHGTDVTIGCIASDATSGLANSGDASFNLSTSVTSGTETNNASTDSRTVSDLAGNSATAGPVTGNKVDKKAPVISCGSPDTSWHATDQSVTCTATDGGSGLANPADASFTLSTSVGDGTETDSAQTGTHNVSDAVGNGATAGPVGPFKIDKKAPSIALFSRTNANANGWNNTNVELVWSCVDDGSGVVSATDTKTVSTEGAGQSATGTCTDNVGHSATNTVTGINIDKTAPAATASASPAANANGWNNTNVTVSFSGIDSLSGIDFCDTAVVLSSEGAGQSASGTCTDKAGNVSALASKTGINIDKTNPSVALVGGPADGGSYYFGFVPAAPTCSASDALSGLDGSCAVSGYSAAVGSHTVTASAKDKAGNTNSASATYTVLGWTLNGFYQPVDVPGSSIVWNTVKNGSTVPLKFNVFAGTTELTDTANVKSLTYKVTTCSSDPTDAVETTATGGTSLRYDTTADQFVYNWQTPETPGACLLVTMTTQDASTLSAYFKLK